MTSKLPKITRQFLLENKSVIFHPRSQEEAMRMQDALFELGVFWPVSESDKRKYMGLDFLAHGAIVVNDMEIDLKMRHSSTRHSAGIVCQPEQLLNDPEPSPMEKRFNELSAKVDRMTAILERLEAEILGGKADKPGLKP